MTEIKSLVAISTVANGNMAFKNNQDNYKSVTANRINFLSTQDININSTTLVNVSYDTENFCRYSKVNVDQKSQGMFDDSDVLIADALVTCELNHALFLPLADCIGAAIFDLDNQIMMLSHLGRHSLEQNGAYKSVKFLVDKFGCNPENLSVHLSPAPGIESYPLFAFNNESMKEVAFKQLQSAGIIFNNIIDNPIDTTKDNIYYSHSEFLKGNQTEDGRYAIVAIMRKIPHS